MKIIGILLALVVVAVAFIFAFRKGDDAPDAAGSAGATTLGAPPPTDVSRNAKSAADYTKRQTCLAECASEERTCKATSLADESPCIQARTACEGRCP
jgi:hypothetical protein